MYNIPMDKLETDNDLYPNLNLNVGQSLIIAQPEQTYLVKDGDSLQSIANTFGVTVKEMLRNNPYLTNRTYLNVGEELTIRYNKIKEMKVIGYSTTSINSETLKKTLPFLNYITIFNYQYNAQGELNDIDGAKIIQTAQDYEVPSKMSVSDKIHEDIKSGSRQQIAVYSLSFILNYLGTYIILLIFRMLVSYCLMTIII